MGCCTIFLNKRRKESVLNRPLIIHSSGTKKFRKGIIMSTKTLQKERKKPDFCSHIMRFLLVLENVLRIIKPRKYPRILDFNF